MRDENLLKAFSAWEELSQSKQDVISYQSRLKYILDEEGKLDDVKYKAEKAGMEKGLEQGLEQGKQERNEAIVRNLVSKGMDIEFIQEVTGLSKEAIEDIQKPININ